jgi:hypothetical protein
MKFTRWSLAAIPLALLCFGWTVSRSADPLPELPQGAPGQNVNPHAVPVIVELFTSEGCSSCPPADALLAKLESQQPIANTQVIALEEHVDYWNNGGWMDPFSGREWTIRQEEYAGVLKNQNPYTPQIVVDGHTEFVGNREDAAREAIEKAAAQPKTHVVLSLSSSGKSGTAEATVSVDHLSAAKHGDKPEIWLAITEAGLHSAVSAGENAGNDLHHASVARAFYKFGSINPNKEASFTGTSTVRLNSSWKRQNLRIVAFVQDQKSRQILGAATASVEP